MAKWFAIALWKRVMLGLVVGGTFGLLAREIMGIEAGSEFITSYVYPIGEAFVTLIRMLIIPLIFTTLVSGVTSMGDPKRLGTLGVRTILLYLGTTAFAVTLGLVIATLVAPGEGATLAGLTADASSVAQISDRLELAGTSGSVSDRLLAIIPSNPIGALANGDVLAVIFFSILLGIGCLMAGEQGKSLAKSIDDAATVMMKLTMIVMETAPFGVFALMAWVLATKGLAILAVLGAVVFALYLACILHIIFIYGGMIRLMKLPVGRFFKDVIDAQAIAFSTASSSAALPVTMACANKNLGIHKNIASSVLPLGATINMDGTAIYLGVVALFAAQLAGIEMTMTTYFAVAVMATLSSIGAAGIPSAGLLLAASVVSVVGLDEASTVAIIAFIFPFDRILDMMRTMTNVTGDIAVATTVAKMQGELDEDVFRAEPEA